VAEAPLELVVLDVNETLSDLAPLRDAFESVGLGATAAPSWFAGVLRDGFALTCVGVNPTFSDLAAGSLRLLLEAHGRSDPAPAVEHVMEVFMSLPVHPDVVAGLRSMADAGLRLVTLSNGSAGVAGGLLERAGIAAVVERTLSVEDARAWKPHGSAYAYALEVCGVAADAAMLVAVHPWDIDGASRAGLRTAWLNRAGGDYPDYFRGPDLRPASMTELAELLG
jgi:2-haloacid dehalogenase